VLRALLYVAFLPVFSCFLIRECLKKSWNYPAIARKNPFYAQVWDCQHSKDETYEIPMKYSAYDITNE
jgi:hypothetical protein